MRSRLVLIILTVFVVTACKDENRIPGGVLSQEKMELVLWDMMRADQFLAEFILNKDSSLNKTIESTKMYQQVLAIHEISQEKFNESFSFYQSHPGLLKTIMDSLNKKPIISPRTDSLRPVITEDTVQMKTVTDTTRRSVTDTQIRRKSVKDTARRSIKSIRGL